MATEKKPPAKKKTPPKAAVKKAPAKKKTVKKTVSRTRANKTVKNDTKPEGKKPRGRPTDYRKEYNDQAFKYCLLGATDAVLGNFFGVSEQTINSWKKEFPSFLESVSRGKDKADAEVALSYYKRATGFTHKVEKPLVISVGNFKSKVEIATYNETVLADANAAHKWLHNRQQKLWPDKQNIALGELPMIGVLLDLPEGYEQEAKKDQHDGDDSGE